MAHAQIILAPRIISAGLKTETRRALTHSCTAAARCRDRHLSAYSIKTTAAHLSRQQREGKLLLSLPSCLHRFSKAHFNIQV